MRTGFRIGLITAAAVLATAPLSPASAGTTVYDEDNFSVGDSGITVTVSGDVYSGYPISAQPLQITVNGGKPYNVLAWCIDFNHNIGVPGTYYDYQVVPFTAAGLASVSGDLNSPMPASLLSGLPGSQTTINEVNYLMDLGDTLLATSPSNANDINSAIQLAIWKELYGSAMTYTGELPAVQNEVGDYLHYAAENDATQWPGFAVISADGEQQLAYGGGNVPSVPEPATMTLLAGGLAGLGAWRRRRAA